MRLRLALAAGGAAALGAKRSELPPLPKLRPKVVEPVAGATGTEEAAPDPGLEAPEEVKQIIEAGNIIARSPYLWGGGHGKWLDKGYDCSGSVSFALAAAGLLGGDMRSTEGFVVRHPPGL